MIYHGAAYVKFYSAPEETADLTMANEPPKYHREPSKYSIN